MFEISRRNLVVGSIGAYLAFGLTRPISFIGAAHAQQRLNEPFLKYKIAAWK